MSSLATGSESYNPDDFPEGGGSEATSTPTKQKEEVAFTPGRITQWFQNNKYGEAVRGKYGVYIMICLDFLNDEDRKLAQNNWLNFLKKTSRNRNLCSMRSGLNINIKFIKQAEPR